MLDTYRAVKALTAVGFTETQAQTLIETVGEGRGDLATKDDIDRLAQVTKADINGLTQATKADVDRLAQATRDDVDRLAQATKADLNSLDERVSSLEVAVVGLRADFQALEVRIERRLTNLILQLAILQVMVGGLIVAALKLLP
ncbi:MAG: hypothetical protein OXE05_10020 [Chloroflexi bacterium]|nr:hypothetical protein [Chloroflexota bacterium]